MNTGSIGQIMINLVKGVSGSKPVQLTPGQVVNVQVKEVVGDTALLSYQGQEIIAKLETDVPEGQPIRCMVEGERNGQLVLKVLNLGSEVSPSDVLKSILNKLGIQDNELNRAVIDLMAKMEMPFTQENVRQITAFINSQKIPVQDVWIPVFMKNQGLPLTGEMFNAVKSLLTDMNFLQVELEKLLSATSPESGNPNITGELKQVISNLNQAIRNMQLSGEDSPATVTMKLTNLFKQLVSAEGNGMAQASGQPTGQAGGQITTSMQTGSVQTAAVPAEPTQAAPVAAGPNQPAAVPVEPTQAAPVAAGPNQTAAAPDEPNQAAPATTGTSQAMAVPAEPNQAAPATGGKSLTAAVHAEHNQTVTPAANLAQAASGQTEVKNDREFVNNLVTRLTEAAQKAPGMDNAKREQFLARLSSILGGAGDETSGKQDILPLLNNLVEGLAKNANHNSSELLKLAQNVMNKMEILHNFNNKAEPGRENIMVMYSSVRFEDREEPLSLLVNYRYDGKNKKRDYNSCRVEVKLQTPNLGLVRCEVQVNYRNLNLQFICDNQKTSQFIDSLKQSLVEKLRQMDYQVIAAGTKVETIEEGQGLWFNDKPVSPGLFKINLKV